MFTKHTKIFVCTCLAAGLLAGPAAAEGKLTPEQVREQQAFAIGTQAYVWGYPLIVTEKTRQKLTSVSEAQTQKAPTNQLAKAKQLLGPDYNAVQSPNNDTIYTYAWLDLSEQPVILEVPDFDGRFYTFQFVDMYTNNFTYVSQRTKGFKAQKYAISGPGWSGKLPAGVERIEAPTRDVFMIGRIGVSGPDDLPAVYAMQEKIHMTPLDKYGADYTPPSMPVAEHKEYNGPLAFFEQLGDLMSRNRPAAHDAGLMGVFKEIGLSPDYGFDVSRLDEASKRGLERAIPAGLAMIEEKARNMGREQNGWQYGPVADAYFGTDYLYRAAAGWQSMYVNTPAEAYYPAVYTDADDETLDGSKANYVLHFDKDKFPPVDAFWSTTMYDLKTRLMVANDLKRYSIGDRTPGLKTNEDGSLDIYIQHESPGKDKESNWLPAPKEPFYMLFRMYLARQEVLNGKYALPSVRKFSR